MVVERAMKSIDSRSGDVEVRRGFVLLGAMEQTLRLSETSDSRLTQSSGVQAKSIELAHRATEDITSNTHRNPPKVRTDVQALEDRRGSAVDSTRLALFDSSA